MNYQNIITIEPGKRGGAPCIRGMRITVFDVLGWLASGMSVQEILGDYSEHRPKKIISWPVSNLYFLNAKRRCNY